MKLRLIIIGTALLLAWLDVGRSSGAGAGYFASPVNFSVAYASPSSIAEGDFTGNGKDGLQSLAVASQGIAPYTTQPGGVSIFRGDGQGHFSALAPIVPGIGPNAMGMGPDSVVAGNFFGGTNIDLAVASSVDNSITILRGDGTGGFHFSQKILNVNCPVSLATGSFFTKGETDLVAADECKNQVSILRNLGNTFGSPQPYSAGLSPVSIAVGDFTSNGIQSIAVANLSASQSGISVLLGTGNGTFQPPTNYDVGKEPTSVAVGDFNKDGHDDLAVANSLGNTVSILIGDGNGNFQQSQSYAVGAHPSSVSVGDLDKDGKLDLVVANRDSNTVSVILGYGNGTFQAPQPFPVGGLQPVSVAMGDFYGHGYPDLVVANSGNPATGVSLLANMVFATATAVAKQTAAAAALTATAVAQGTAAAAAQRTAAALTATATTRSNATAVAAQTATAAAAAALTATAVARQTATAVAAQTATAAAGETATAAAEETATAAVPTPTPVPPKPKVRITKTMILHQVSNRLQKAANGLFVKEPFTLRAYYKVTHKGSHKLSGNVHLSDSNGGYVGGFSLTRSGSDSSGPYLQGSRTINSLVPSPIHAKFTLKIGRSTATATLQFKLKPQVKKAQPKTCAKGYAKVNGSCKKKKH